jgi:hypothetical protein
MSSRKGTHIVTEDTQSPGVVILGAGVIGLSTAYYLALSLNENGTANNSLPPIVVVDPSKHICPGASSQATGGLGDFGFGPRTSALGAFSYNLHKELALEHNGRETYAFSDLKIYRVSPENFSGIPSPPNDWGPTPPVDKTLADLPSWVKSSRDWQVKLLADAPHSAHL